MTLALFIGLALAAGDAKKDAGTSAAPEATEVAYAHGISKGWMDFGWSPRKPDPAGGEQHELKGFGGWILVREQPMAPQLAGGLKFTVKAPAAFGDFLEVKLDKPGTSGRDWEKIRPAAANARPQPDGSTEYFIPMSELNPKRLFYDRIVFFAFKDLPAGWVTINDVALTVPSSDAAASAPRTVGHAQHVAIECKRKTHKISPLIYSIAFYPMWGVPRSAPVGDEAARAPLGRQPQQPLQLPARRRLQRRHGLVLSQPLGGHGGRPGYSWETFMQDNAEHGAQSVFTLPMIGWVAKDTSSFSYPKREYPDQQAFENETGAGNGRGKDGKFLPPPPQTRTSIPAPPEFIAKWVSAIHAKATKLNTRATYILDNEPCLWDSTHHDLHPDGVSYDELWQRTRDYASAVKKADPSAQIAGPAEWGWTNYFYSQKDMKNGGPAARPDRRAHGDVPLIPWYLQQLAAYEKQTGTRLVDTLDVHFYPQAQGVGEAETGDTSTEGSLRRIRSTRALWDPTYHDESWIDDNVELIPRMKKWVSENDPGLSTSIGEWNFGAENHISGGLAVAEALGRFGQLALGSAYYWAYPQDGTPAYWAFRAYRDYDSDGAHFESWSLPTTPLSGASVFASMSDDGTKIVAIVLNLDPRNRADGRPGAQRLRRRDADAALHVQGRLERAAL